MNIAKSIKSNFAVTTDDGHQIYNYLEVRLENKKKVVLDFEGIHLLTTAFLNAAIGQLYSKFKTEDIQPYLKLINVAKEDKILFKKVTDRAKEYFAQKKSFEKDSDKTIYGKD